MHIANYDITGVAFSAQRRDQFCYSRAVFGLDALSQTGHQGDLRSLNFGAAAQIFMQLFINGAE
ncbi:hypothetical protein ACVW1L_003420 [Ewingella americana]